MAKASACGANPFDEEVALLQKWSSLGTYCILDTFGYILSKMKKVTLIPLQPDWTAEFLLWLVSFLNEFFSLIVGIDVNFFFLFLNSIGTFSLLFRFIIKSKNVTGIFFLFIFFHKIWKIQMPVLDVIY